MDQMVYVAMTGAREALKAQSVISHNLANISTTGFRALRNTLESAPINGPGLETRVNVTAGANSWDPTAGVAIQTNRNLDVAIQGKGWLAVQGADGEESYTRAGNLRINTVGMLETATGLLVMGNGGPISVPPFQELSIGSDGEISIVPAGQLPNTMAVVNRLKLVGPPAGELVQKEDGTFRLKNGDTAAADPTVKVASGQLESSNVNAAQALVQMIEFSRLYEMQIRAMNTADENSQAAASLMRNG